MSVGERRNGMEREREGKEPGWTEGERDVSRGGLGGERDERRAGMRKEEQE